MALQGVEAERLASVSPPGSPGRWFFPPEHVGTGGKAVGTSNWVTYARVLMEAN